MRRTDNHFTSTFYLGSCARGYRGLHLTFFIHRLYLIFSATFVPYSAVFVGCMCLSSRCFAFAGLRPLSSSEAPGGLTFLGAVPDTSRESSTTRAPFARSRVDLALPAAASEAVLHILQVRLTH